MQSCFYAILFYTSLLQSIIGPMKVMYENICSEMVLNKVNKREFKNNITTSFYMQANGACKCKKFSDYFKYLYPLSIDEPTKVIVSEDISFRTFLSYKKQCG